MEEELIFQVSGPWVGFCAIASSTRTNNSHAKETLPKGVFLQPNNQNTTFTFPYAFLDWSIASKIHENSCAENDYQQKSVTVSKWIKGLKGSWSQRKQITEMSNNNRNFKCLEKR